jgi:hypothetical protein
MKLRRDDTRGLIGSILFHLLIGVLLFFWRVNVSVSEPEFVEVTWGTISSVPSSSAAKPSLAGSEGTTVSPARTLRQADLPERRANLDEDVISVPAGRKLDVDEKSLATRNRLVENSKGQKDRSLGVGLGQKEKFTSPGIGESAGDVANPNTSGTVGTDVGKSVSVSMTWSDGGTRSKISGDLPSYPEGVNVEAQIKIETVVMPDGTVKSLKPAQKGNTRLEETAMNAVRLWKFEPLRISAPQLDQTCIVTFNFYLR